jgi:hypothetical protein
MAERILPTKDHGPASAPVSHAYNDPDISPLEFLLCVMRATHLPMSSRIQAASALLPFTNPYPRADSRPLPSTVCLCYNLPTGINQPC